MADDSTYSIKYVSLQTGLKPYLIRSWESRYQAVCPVRADNHRRCFTDADIRRLRLLKQAVEQGHAISGVSKLTDAELNELLQRPLRRHAPNLEAPGANPPAQVLEIASDIVETAIAQIRRLDAAALERILNDAAVDMPRQAFLQSVVLPLLETIGTMWRAGEIKIIGEHMASVVIRSLLWDMLRSVDLSEEAPRIVVATPVGHWHEFGALAAALAASESGWRAAYFGPNLPSEEIAYATRRIRARALALSLCHRLVDNRLAPELSKLRRLVGDRLPIFVGGSGVDFLKRMKLRVGAIYVNDLDALRNTLDRLAADHTA